MLRLKRASAGSGKTFQLAKTYIKLLLTSKQEGFIPRLRNPLTLQEALGSIMAVTFTVKATGEMKERIVKNLADLARADQIEDSEIDEIHYLREFIEDLNLNRYELAALAREALRTLLLHYSEFRVQTIDSFFQSILHTFTYEANLDNDFNMEIDTEYVSSVGLDNALDEMSETTPDMRNSDQTLHWLRLLMGRNVGQKNWNVFTRQNGNRYLYSELIREAKNLEKEEYQELRDLLKNYFGSLDRPFTEIIEEVDDANFERWRLRHEKMHEAALRLKQLLDRVGFTEKDLYKNQGGKFKDSLLPFDKNKVGIDKTPVSRGKDAVGFSLSGAALKALPKIVSADPALNPSFINDIDGAYADWMEAFNDYKTFHEENQKDLNTWMQFKAMIPRLMMVLEISRRKEDYLKATNSLQISDTNYILAQILDGSETPFVYERMGSFLNHFLIDEFQDTSKMQWENLRPLLENSDSNYHDNLIIGDAKQSIYRFRNADYKLILEVEKSHRFSKVVDYTTEKKPKDRSAQNTNYRSLPRVVEFNNYLFSHIVDLPRLGVSTDEKIFPDVVTDIYSDCIQALPKPKKKPGEKRRPNSPGYVESIFYPEPEKEEREEADSIGFNSLAEAGFQRLPELILELRGRGYAFRKIGILVKTHSQGQAAMKAISNHNAKPENAERQIPVISEEDLLVSSALSVSLIIHALGMVTRGLQGRLTENPVLHEPVEESELFAMLKTLNSMSLPSLVEAIVERFIPTTRRNAEAPFIAAFQDAVIDYCSTRNSDIGSFLTWWKTKSKTLSITSPEDSDGVVLQTIHKAKGLEHLCVIIPKADFTFQPTNNKAEWRWVKPAECVARRELLPPVLPLLTTDKLKETAHSDIYEHYCEEVALDELNKMYVALTRASEELYVFFPVSKKPGDSKAGDLVKRMLENLDPESDTLKAEITIEEEDNGNTVVRYGEKQPRPVKATTSEDADAGALNTIGTYEVHSDRSVLKFEKDQRLLKRPIHTGDSEEDLDPRAEGTLKHRIMQMVMVPSDLDKALREMRVAGYVSRYQVEQWGEQLREAIDSVADRRWFDPAMRVLAERPILQQGKESYRPDRIVIDEKGNACIIDYKFGAKESKNKEQIRNYAELLRKSGAATTVRASLWYITSKEIVDL